MNGCNWVKAICLPSKDPIWINLNSVFSMMVISQQHHPSYTRVWSGDQSIGPTPKDPERAFIPLPLCIDIEETPEQLFMKAFGSLPGETQ
jgi:hypothetical protein